MVHISILDHIRVKYELFRWYFFVKQYVAFVYHLDDYIVVNTMVWKVSRPGDEWSKDVGSDRDGHIVWSHLIERFILHYVPKEFDMELQGVEMESVKFIDQVFEIRNTLWFGLLLYLSELLIILEGDQRLFHFPQQPLPVIRNGVYIGYFL